MERLHQCVCSLSKQGQSLFHLARSTRSLQGPSPSSGSLQEDRCRDRPCLCYFPGRGPGWLSTYLPSSMARQSRLVAEGIVHHAVARGVNKTRIFQNGFDKGRYLKRVAMIADQEKVLIHGYCLMENHVHFLLTPTSRRGLARFFSRLHTWWAMYFNKKRNRTGHLFQGRYFSSPLSECHYWTALRYVELNPVRAKLVNDPENWPWSSVRGNHSLRQHPIIPLTPVQTRSTAYSAPEWRQVLRIEHLDEDEQIRKAYRSSRPCGPPEFVRKLQEKFKYRTVVNSASPQT